jgi:hypothetical protein
MIHNSMVGIATGYRLDDGSEFESQRGHKYPILHIGQAGSGTHPASCPIGTKDKVAGV